MTLSAEQIQGLADAVSEWRLQECIFISFYCFYVYYVLTTIDEEVAAIFPQKWNCGKVLFIVIRHITLVVIAIPLSRDYRNYFTISPKACKDMLIAYEVAHYGALIACDVALGLCISALLQVHMVYVVLLTIVCAGPNAAQFVVMIVSKIQALGGPVSALDRELGYPCYATPGEEIMKSTLLGQHRDVRSSINAATAILMVIVVITTLVVRYKGRTGRLVQVIRRDGALYYVVLAGIRLGKALVDATPIVPIDKREGNAGVLVLGVAEQIVVPIFAQRLMLNIRNIDYMGSRPFASKLLFAPQPPDSDDDFDSIELDAGRAGLGSASQSHDPSARA